MIKYLSIHIDKPLCDCYIEQKSNDWSALFEWGINLVEKPEMVIYVKCRTCKRYETLPYSKLTAAMDIKDSKKFLVQQDFQELKTTLVSLLSQLIFV